jgi:hypothetical protein
LPRKCSARGRAGEFEADREKRVRMKGLSVRERLKICTPWHGSSHRHDSSVSLVRREERRKEKHPKTASAHKKGGKRELAQLEFSLEL